MYIIFSTVANPPQTGEDNHSKFSVGLEPSAKTTEKERLGFEFRDRCSDTHGRNPDQRPRARRLRVPSSRSPGFARVQSLRELAADDPGSFGRSHAVRSAGDAPLLRSSGRSGTTS